jgi:hypothetical protein
MSYFRLLKYESSYFDENGAINLTGLVHLTYNLPEFWLSYKYQQIIDWSDDTGYGQFLAILRQTYIAKAYWLAFLLLGRTDLESELKKIRIAERKILAEATCTYYDLARAVWTRLSTEGKTTICSPEHWVLLIELEQLDINLKKAGLYRDTQPIGKHKFYKRLISEIEPYLDLDVSHIGTNNQQKLTSPTEFLLQKSAEFAAIEPGFEENYHLPFLKQYKRLARKFERSSDRCVYVDQKGNLRVIGRGKQAKRKRGFS